MTQTLNNLPAMQETRIQSLGWEDSLEKGMATHSNILAWRIHGQNSLVGYSPWGHKESGITKRLSLSIESGSHLGHPGQELWQISTTCPSFLESLGRQCLGAATNLLVPMAQASAQS